ncbi:hybrid sensor histidine kinase/response regulator [Marinobacter vulgaris]|uniref:histidine kinase n=1 Tax=Marinobacter vulgaris TaxID=1928331 RepID=A0A2V3ZQD3_9GAMM|nr:NahK/ErcS family hybrid sensor histidine kinase/response regulator [Marinobacter vulgaris]PXX93549.1 hybrid sensor histidine kinase/response regulator [Marinobacter vulgaris]TSJ72436.1 response regulator [Marinobacter vulgaris]
MQKPSDSGETGYEVGDLLGLGSQSLRKNYYPALQERIEELEIERNRYKWLFENALHGIFQANLRGGFVAANPAMARICGYDSADELIAGVIRLREQLFCSSGDFDDIRQELLNQGSLSARETRLRRSDSTPVHVAITLLRRPDLGPEVVEAFVADITERHQAREKLRQLNADLERRVEERTDELQNANESKDKYLAAASHDLLQPLNAARLLVSALMDSNLPADESRLVHRVQRSLESAEDLLSDLLDISRLEQKAMQPDYVHTDIGELMRGLAQEFEPLAENADLNFRVRAGHGSVRTDPRMLTRILRNLLSNAFRYTDTGGVLFAARKRGPNLEIGIWDTGVGIEKEKLADIFREFHQILPKGSSRQGVGLGLAIVDRMARVLGCEIRVDSSYGRGSCFSILLPLSTVMEASPSARSIAAPVPATSSFDGLRVLVIDNEEPVQESMRALLERWGCHVVTAASADEAIERCRGVDIMLADFHLDDNLTGCEAIQEVRRRFGHDIPAAVITADRGDETLRLIRAQRLPVLNKPVKPNRLRALVTSLSASLNPVRE